MPEKTMEKPPSLVLASTSVYRRALLARLGLAFTTAAPGVDETPLPEEAPADTACRLALAKAQAVAARLSHGLVLGSDQVADVDGMSIGKPTDHATAVRQLALLSGRAVVFHTGVALVDAATGRHRARLVDVTTKFRTLTPQAIDAYLRRERPYDCAASIKSEALGIAIVESIESDDPTALIGLPLITVVDLLQAEGVDVLGTDDVSRYAGDPRPFA